MSDIVERLRDVVCRWWRTPEDAVVVTEAADEITRLRAALRWFVDEYEKVQAMRQARVHAPECRCVLCAYDNARAALEGRDEK